MKYKPDQTILKVYGYGDNKKIKVIRMNWLRTAGVEDDEENRSPKGSVHDFKLEENIQRAKNIIFEYAFCNPWDWFFTGTLNLIMFTLRHAEEVTCLECAPCG